MREGQVALIAAVIIALAVLALLAVTYTLIQKIERPLNNKVTLRLGEEIENITVYNTSTVVITLAHRVNVATIECINTTLYSGVSSLTEIYRNRRVLVMSCLPNYSYIVDVPNSEHAVIYTRARYNIVVSPRKHWYRDEIVHWIYAQYPTLSLNRYSLSSSRELVENMTEVVQNLNYSNIVMISLRERYLTLGSVPLNMSVALYSMMGRDSPSKMILLPVMLQVRNTSSPIPCKVLYLDNLEEKYFLQRRFNFTLFGKGLAFRSFYLFCNDSPVLEVENITVNVSDYALNNYRTDNITLIKYLVLKRDVPSVWNSGIVSYPYLYYCTITPSATNYSYSVSCDLTTSQIAYFVINITIPLSGIRSNVSSFLAGLYTNFIINSILGTGLLGSSTLYINYTVYYVVQLNVGGVSGYVYYAPLNVTCSYNVLVLFRTSLVYGDCTPNILDIALAELPSWSQIKSISVFMIGILERTSGAGVTTSFTVGFLNASLIPVR